MQVFNSLAFLWHSCIQTNWPNMCHCDQMLDLRRAICISPISNSTHHNQQYITNSLTTASTSTILVTTTITTIIVIIRTFLSFCSSTWPTWPSSWSQPAATWVHYDLYDPHDHDHHQHPHHHDHDQVQLKMQILHAGGGGSSHSFAKSSFCRWHNPPNHFSHHFDHP